MLNGYIEQILNAVRKSAEKGGIPDPQIMRSDTGDVLFRLHYIRDKFNPNIYVEVKIKHDQTEQVIESQGYIVFHLTYYFNNYRMSPSQILTAKFVYHYVNEPVGTIYKLKYNLLNDVLDGLFQVYQKTNYLYTVIEDESCGENLVDFIKKHRDDSIEDKVIPLRGRVDDNRSVTINQVIYGGIKLDDYQNEPMTLPNLMVLGKDGKNTLHLPNGRIIQNPIVDMKQEREFILDLLNLPRTSSKPNIVISNFLRYLIANGCIYRDNDIDVLQFKTIAKAMTEINESNRKVRRAFAENVVEFQLPKYLGSDEYTISEPYRRFEGLDEEIRFNILHHPTGKYGSFVIGMKVAEHNGLSISKFVPKEIDMISGKKGFILNQPLIIQEESENAMIDYIKDHLYSPEEILESFPVKTKYPWEACFTKRDKSNRFLGWMCTDQESHFSIIPAVIFHLGDGQYHVQLRVSIHRPESNRPDSIKMWFKSTCENSLSIQDALASSLSKNLLQIEAFIDKVLSIDWSTNVGNDANDRT